MFNERPLDDPRTQEALDMIGRILRQYDLAGAICVINEHEMGYAYNLYTTWNIVIEDSTLPLGFRFRVKEAEQNRERAQALILGTAHMLCQMLDFGNQTRLWMSDMLQMLKRTGLKITHIPFNGRKLPRLTSEPPR